MDDADYDIIRLLRDYFIGKAEESDKLADWLDARSQNRAFFERLQKGSLAEREAFFRQMDVPQAFAKFRKRINRSGHSRIRKSLYYAASFVLPFLLAGGIGWFFFQRQEAGKTLPVTVQPGRYKALLTLENGHTIALDEHLKNDVLVSGDVQVVNTGQEIIYRDSLPLPTAMKYNVLTTSRGGEYCLTFSDGSRVYLNAASRLKYPVTFAAREREVYLSGEACFEIAADSLRPFYVVTDAVRIRVYGTVFNVNTHFRDKVQTALVSGMIGITGKETAEEILMHPAELSEFSGNGSFLGIRKVDPTLYISWRTGRFLFENERLEDLLDRLALWYDLNIFYTHSHLKEQHFTGSLEKYENIEVILDAIYHITGVKFIVRGNAVTVTE